MKKYILFLFVFLLIICPPVFARVNIFTDSGSTTKYNNIDDSTYDGKYIINVSSISSEYAYLLFELTFTTGNGWEAYEHDSQDVLHIRAFYGSTLKKWAHYYDGPATNETIVVALPAYSPADGSISIETYCVASSNNEYWQVESATLYGIESSLANTIQTDSAGSIHYGSGYQWPGNSFYSLNVSDLSSAYTDVYCKLDFSTIGNWDQYLTGTTSRDVDTTGDMIRIQASYGGTDVTTSYPYYIGDTGSNKELYVHLPDYETSDGSIEIKVDCYAASDEYFQVDGMELAGVSDEDVYTISASAETGGAISPSGSVVVTDGDSQSFTITPNPGNAIDDVLVDGISQGALSSYNFSNVASDHTIVAKFQLPPEMCLNATEVPLDTLSVSAPGNVMFVLDDSGSMNFEILVQGEVDGRFNGQECYVFEDPGDNTYTDSARYFDSIGKRDYRSQWSGYNFVYYDPTVRYEPWPDWQNITGGDTASWPEVPDADPDTPRSDPMSNVYTVNLDDTFYSVQDDEGLTVDVKKGHYFQQYNGSIYLVNLNGDSDSIEIYQYDDANHDNIVDDSELAATTLSEGTLNLGNYTSERQNFANWFSFYRRREHAAKAAVARVIKDMHGVRIGMLGINNSLVQPLLPIRVEENGTLQDYSDTLLEALYTNYHGDGGTPLRTGLEKVGEYYKTNNGNLEGVSGENPYYSQVDGGECQQAFAIVMTDGFYSGSDPSVGNTDGDDNTPYDGGIYSDSYSNTLADVAMEYYENDLNTNLGNYVPTNEQDYATHQHMVTYGISFGVQGTLDFENYECPDSCPTWTEPDNTRIPETIDDLWHATVNGRGSFMSANNPQELVNVLQILQFDIEARIGTAASVSVNGDELYEIIGDDTRLFQTSYSSDGWIGDVKSFRVETDTGEVITSSYEWSAADELAEKDWDERVIATYDGSTGVPLQFSQISSHQQDVLSSNATEAEHMLEYLRGNKAREEPNGAYRKRVENLLDIVHSSPVYEEGVIYAGGNDGFLHAFNATNGEEMFAYMPNLIFGNHFFNSRLDELTQPEYSHKYFVDLTPTVQSGVDLSLNNRTLLVGGLGLGGKGLFCLDVTNAGSIINEQNLAGRVKWEFPTSFDNSTQVRNLGYSLSKPVIVKTNDANYPWVVVCGNGYNSENGHAVLYVLEPEYGTVLKMIDTGVGGCNGLSSPTAVDVDQDQNYSVDYVYAGDLQGNLWKFDFTSSSFIDWDVAYANSGVTKPLFQAQGPGGTTQPIIIKPDVMYHCEKHGYLVVFGTGLYLGQEDILDTHTYSIYGIWDYGDDSDDSEYLGSFQRGSTPELSNQPQGVSLLEQKEIDWTEQNGTWFRTLSKNATDWSVTTENSSGQCLAGDAGEGNSPCDPNDVGEKADPVAHAGWFFDLPLSGERITSDVMIRDGKAIVISFTPNQSPCMAGGSSIVHEMDACSGGRLNKPQFDINGDDEIDEDDTVQVPSEGELPPTGMQKPGRLQTPAILGLPDKDKEVKYFSSSTGQIQIIKEKKARMGIYYWKEVGFDN
jgi:type IV pilus assembly protein PilY1